eukprot:5086517-Pleurochrysis_carterae.AAC.3
MYQHGEVSIYTRCSGTSRANFAGVNGLLIELHAALCSGSLVARGTVFVAGGAGSLVQQLARIPNWGARIAHAH